jgi:hypothetical protein
MTEKPKTVDFGAPDKFGAHVFRIEIPAAKSESVVIVEDYGYRGQEAGVPRDEERVVLKRPVWSAIADIARREFNTRLKAAKVRVGRWHTGTNLWTGFSARSCVSSHGPRKQPIPTRFESFAANGRPSVPRSAGGSLP